MNVRHFLLCFFLFPIYMFAQPLESSSDHHHHHHHTSIVGTYDVAGFDPSVPEYYTGTAVITEDEGIYTIVWTFCGSDPLVGTGVRQHDDISFVYRLLGTHHYGTQLYKIYDDTLKGPWIPFEGNAKGYERITKICGGPSDCF